MNDQGYWFHTELKSVTEFLKDCEWEEAIPIVRKFVSERLCYSASDAEGEYHEFLDKSYIYINYDDRAIVIFDGNFWENSTLNF